METLHSTKELIKYISNMNRDNSVCQFYIPGIGRFTLVLQEEDEANINEEAKMNPELKKMIRESREEYRQGLGMSTSDLLDSLSPRDFE